MLVGQAYKSAEQAYIADLKDQIHQHKITIAGLQESGKRVEVMARQNAIAYQSLKESYDDDIVRVHNNYEQFSLYYKKCDKLQKEVARKDEIRTEYDAQAKRVADETLAKNAIYEETIKSLRTQLEMAAYSAEDYPIVQELRRITDEKDETIRSLESKLTQAKKDQEFFREQYQRASSEGGMLSSQIQDLTRDLVDANRRADDIKVKVHTINMTNREAIYTKRIMELVAELKHCKDTAEFQKPKRNRQIETTSVDPDMTADFEQMPRT